MTIRISSHLNHYFSFFAEEFLFWKSRFSSHSLVTNFEASKKTAYLRLLEINDNKVVNFNFDAESTNIYLFRYKNYIDFLNIVLKQYPINKNIFIPICVDDGEEINNNIPYFCFQKQVNSQNFLLPDIDFLKNIFYTRPDHKIAESSFEKKKNKAIFTGSTTGAGLIDIQKIKKNQVPRICSAMYFIDQPNVIFKLPSIVQCTDEAKKFLETYPFCDCSKISYEEQFKHKFILSIDGNGATCSRIALTLKSQSVLLKYDSTSILFYFKKLIPWHHYIPVHKDADVETIIEMEKEQSKFGYIAQNANEFYQQYLQRDKQIEYTACLLHYFSILS